MAHPMPPQVEPAGAIGSSPMARGPAPRDTSGLRNLRTTAKWGNDPLDRFLFRLDLQPVRRVAVIHRVAMLSFADGLPGRPQPRRQRGGWLVIGLDRRPNLRRRRRLLVKMDLHVRTPLQKFFKIDLAMKNAERRRSM